MMMRTYSVRRIRNQVHKSNAMQKGHEQHKRKFDNKRIAIQRMKLGIELIRIRCFVGVGAQHRIKTNRRWKYTRFFFLILSLGFLFLTQIENKLTLKINQTKSQIENEMRNRSNQQNSHIMWFCCVFSLFFVVKNHNKQQQWKKITKCIANYKCRTVIGFCFAS